MGVGYFCAAIAASAIGGFIAQASFEAARRWWDDTPPLETSKFHSDGRSPLAAVPAPVEVSSAPQPGALGRSCPGGQASKSCASTAPRRRGIGETPRWRETRRNSGSRWTESSTRFRSKSRTKAAT